MKFFAKSNKQGRVGIEFDPYGLAVASLTCRSGETVKACTVDYLEGLDEKQLAKALKSLVRAQGLENLPCSVVLHPRYYELHLVERPDVADAEVSDAVKWALKDQLSRPMNELVFDAFSIPEDAYSNSARMVYAVVAERAMLMSLNKMMRNADLLVDSIQIAELANTGIVNLVAKEPGSTALLCLRNSAGSIVLSDHNAIYLARQLDKGVAMIEGADIETQYRLMDELLLDIQRSLDYYDSQLRKGIVRNFLFAPTQIFSERVIRFLQDNLNLRVNVLDLNELFDVSKEIPSELQARCFGAVGAAACGVMH